MLREVDYDPFNESPFDAAVRLEGVTDPKEVAFLKSLHQQESGGKAEAPVSNRGATGPMQIIPDTFKSVADPGWDIKNPYDSTRAGVRYARQRYLEAGGDMALAAAGYYGGPGGQAKAAQGVAVRDPYNPKNPDTLQYGSQVAQRAGRLVEVDHNPFADEPNAPVPKFEIRGTSADVPTPAPPQSFPKALGSSFKSAGANLAAGAGDIGSTLLAPTDLLADWLSNDKLGTANTSRRQSIEDFVRENVDQPDSFVSRFERSIPELAVTASPMSKSAQAVAKVLPETFGRLRPLLGDVAVNAPYEAGKAVSRSGDPNDAIEGAKAGAEGAVLGRALAKVVTGAGSLASKGMRELTDRGYIPTIAEMSGKAGQVYDYLASRTPFFSGAVHKAEDSATRSYSRAETNRAIEQIGGRTEKTGEGAVAEGEKAVSDAYERVKPYIELTAPRGRHAVRAADVEISRQVPLLDANHRRLLNKFISTHITPRFATGRLHGSAWKDLDRELGNEARRYEKETASAADENMGRALRILQRNLRRMVSPTFDAPSNVLKDLSKANTAFREMLAVRDATRRTPGHAGHFTPSEYAAAADRFKVKRGEGNEAIRREATPPAPPGKGTPETALRYAAPVGLAAYFGAEPLMRGLASFSPGPVLGATAAGTAWGVHQLANTERGRSLLYNGLAGLVPDSMLSRIYSLPPQQAAKAFRDLLARPELANIAAQIGRQYQEIKHAP